MSYFIVTWELERLRATQLYLSEPQSSLQTTILLEERSCSCSPLHHHQLTALLSLWESAKHPRALRAFCRGRELEGRTTSYLGIFPLLQELKNYEKCTKLMQTNDFVFVSFYLASILIKTFCHVCWASSKCCNAAAMGMQKSCSAWGKKTFSTFTKSTTVITTRINQIYSRQTRGIIFFCACGHKRVYFCCNAIKFSIFHKSDGLFW